MRAAVVAVLGGFYFHGATGTDSQGDIGRGRPGLEFVNLNISSTVHRTFQLIKMCHVAVEATIINGNRSLTMYNHRTKAVNVNVGVDGSGKLDAAEILQCKPD